MPGHPPTVKRAAYSLSRQLEALSLVGKGLPISEVAQRMDLTPANVRRHLHKALESGLTLYPNALTADEVASLRQIQAEVLANSRQKAIETHTTIAARIGTENEKNMDATASARLLEAVVRAIEMESNLFGTRQPTRIIEESLRVQLTKVDGRVVVHFDRDQLKPRWPTPYGAREPICLNGMSPDRLFVRDHENAPDANLDTLEGSGDEG